MKKASVLIWAGLQRDPSFLLGLLLSLSKQNYENWEAIVQTDGQRPDIDTMLNECGKYLQRDKIFIHPTDKPDGRWGYGCKDHGVSLCTGDYIGFNNDDNYIVPGFIEQHVKMIEHGHDLVLCDIVHHYNQWEVLSTSPSYGHVDLCSWMAKAELVRGTEWPGDYREADGHFVERMAKNTQKIGKINRPLLIHN